MVELVHSLRCLGDKHSSVLGYLHCALKWNFLKLDLLGDKRRSLLLSLSEN